MQTGQRGFARRVPALIGSALMCVGALAPVSDAAAVVSASITVAYQGVGQASGQSFPAGPSGSATFSYQGTGHFVTTGSSGEPPADELDVYVDNGTGCTWVPSNGPVSSGYCGSSSLVLGVGNHTLYSVAYDQNGTSAQSAVFSLTVRPSVPGAPTIARQCAGVGHIHGAVDQWRQRGHELHGDLESWRIERFWTGQSACCYGPNQRHQLHVHCDSNQCRRYGATFYAALQQRRADGHRSRAADLSLCKRSQQSGYGHLFAPYDRRYGDHQLHGYLEPRRTDHDGSAQPPCRHWANQWDCLHVHSRGNQWSWNRPSLFCLQQRHPSQRACGYLAAGDRCGPDIGEFCGVSDWRRNVYDPALDATGSPRSRATPSTTL
jgi:hypothetical protein